MAEVAELLHDDYAYLFEAYWDLWTPPEGAEKWVLEPSLVRVIAHGIEFEEHAAEQAGHIQIDFGLDSSFLHEEVVLTSEAERNVRSNVQKLVELTHAQAPESYISETVLSHNDSSRAPDVERRSLIHSNVVARPKLRNLTELRPANLIDGFRRTS